MPATVNAGQSQNITEITVTASGSGATARYTAYAGDTLLASNLSADKLNEKLGFSFSSNTNIHDGDTFSLKVLGGSSAADDKISAKIDITQADAVEAKDAEYTTVITDASGNLVSSSSFDFEFGEKFGYDEDGYPQSSTTFNVNVDASKALVFHIGANSGQNTTLNMNNMNAESLGIDALDLTTQKGADASITTIDEAITTVSAQRAALGAMQNRLEHTINNLSTTSENLTASESQIRDVDMAKEMTSFTKNNILVQAAQSMLAQANQQPQNVLQLLQG
ncbi:MAG: hypothetical protein K6F52_02825 [Clostridia bacterium]|nr:hypothetical protein [Clostridia bacterium]